ncbi:MAG: hypothetical protein NTW21_44390 [Verrucomicrobia bacterium]|nr:hypothetical protein [Verrucomicrobiota bacterium]
MILDLFICGPGYGETIICRWEEEGRLHAGVIDCYGPNYGLTVYDWLLELEISQLEFLCVTHPHLDHIYNAYWVLELLEGSVSQLWWWGGLTPDAYIVFCDKLAAACGGGEGRLRSRAESVRRLFIEIARQEQKFGIPLVRTSARIKQLYPIPQTTNPVLKITAFSPWDDSLMRFTKEVVSSIRVGGKATSDESLANLACIGLLLQYGNAQVVLGSDIEASNWNSLPDAFTSSLRPCVVKVSHHGSQNGTCAGMWSMSGFLCNQQPQSPIAVITPWHNVLPDEKVIKQIVGSGSTVFVTGQKNTNGRGRPWLSYVHVQVDGDQGTARVVEKSANVVVYEPVPPLS